MDGLRDDHYYGVESVHTCLYVRVRETGDWDLLLGHLEWARAETGGERRASLKRRNRSDQWVLQRRGFPGVARVYSSTCPWDTHYQFSIKTLLSNKVQTVNNTHILEQYVPFWSPGHVCTRVR